MIYNENLTASSYNPVAKITVIGVGGGGNNSVEAMVGGEIKGVNFIFANTDRQVLDRFDPAYVIHLGSEDKQLGE